MGSQARGWIIGADCNATPQSETIGAIEQAGFRFAHAAIGDIATCNVNADARMIDYLFYSRALTACPALPIKIDRETVLPTAEQPSDHVAVAAEFDWAR